ncbi:MAG: hypothetical protein QXP41_00420 [Candidatus Nitrosocaldus sp.]
MKRVHVKVDRPAQQQFVRPKPTTISDHVQPPVIQNIHKPITPTPQPNKINTNQSNIGQSNNVCVSRYHSNGRQHRSIARPVQHNNAVPCNKTAVRYLHTPKLVDKSIASKLNGRHTASLEPYRDRIIALRDSGRGRILVMVACGPSILEAQIERLNGHKNIDIMCINKPDKRVWPSKYWAFCDQSQYNRNKDLWDSYNGTIINASSVRARHNNQILIKNLPARGFSRDLVKGYYIGRSSTYANLQVAMWMNYDKIYIFGLDMCAVDGKLHYYGKNPDVTDEQRIERFSREADNYMFAAKEVLTPDERNRIILCSSYNKFPFTEMFPRLHQKDAVDVILMENNK